MKAKFLTSLISLLLISPSGLAVTISGTNSGFFDNPTGPEEMLVSGVGTNIFKWGEPAKFGPSKLKYFGQNFVAETESPFILGKLKYFNGTIYSGTEADSVQFNTTIQFNELDVPEINFTFNFDLINTINKKNNSKDENADIVYLTNSYANEIFQIDGVDHTLKLLFGNVYENGFSELDKFFVHEGKYAHTKLLGIITSDIPVPIPIPATLPLFLSAIMGIALVGRSRNRESAA